MQLARCNSLAQRTGGDGRMQAQRVPFMWEAKLPPGRCERDLHGGAERHQGSLRADRCLQMNWRQVIARSPDRKTWYKLTHYEVCCGLLDVLITDLNAPILQESEYYWARHRDVAAARVLLICRGDEAPF